MNTFRKIPAIGQILINEYRNWPGVAGVKNNSLCERINFAKDYIISKRRDITQGELIEKTFKQILPIKDERDIVPIQWGCGSESKKFKKKVEWKHSKFKTRPLGFSKK